METAFFRLVIAMILLVLPTWLLADVSTSSSNQAITATPDLKQIMADPDWIGRPVEQAWWQMDGESIVYQIERTGSDQRDWVEIQIDTLQSNILDAAARAQLDGPDPVFDTDYTRALSLRDGNVILRDLASGKLRQLTGSGQAQIAQFSTQPERIHVLQAGQWWQVDLTTGIRLPVANLVMQDRPFEVSADALAEDQLRLFSVLREQAEEQRRAHEEAIAAASLDPNLPPVAWYLGDDHEIDFSMISADGRWLFAVVSKPGSTFGRNDVMPRFVTRSGYVEAEDVRTLVGRNASEPQQVWLLDLENRSRHNIDLTTLSGRDEDPLAELKQAQDIKPFDADTPRPVRIIGIEWHPQQATVAFLVRAIDNKDRWLVTLEAESQEWTERHRLTDPGWINWAFNEFGWVPGRANDLNLWLLSEQSGYSHLYTIELDRNRQRQHTDGAFEVFDIQWHRDGQSALLLSNRSHPTEYDLYRLQMGDDELTRLTEMQGLESFALHPITGQAVLRFSNSYQPTQAAVFDPAQNRVLLQTDTRTEDYREIEWQQPEIVGVPSSHGADQPIWSKFYPARGEINTDEPRPAVLFVHGAGYLQNTHHRFPVYFREQMFHNLLTAHGYHVLDMDFRASRGYGRDWRTAIYRQMGTPELEDLIDGVNWLVENHNVDPQRIGVYGGSYGGFMAFMAMFNAPEVFTAGAALRPVTDWTHYNHGYTSNILNTPQVDPEAFLRSSPIEFAENLQGHLLISHGMLDDNVFYKDSVRLAQRLIELEKENWELASYPMEPHGYIHPTSWLDQYRRIFKLFESTIGK